MPDPNLRIPAALVSLLLVSGCVPAHRQPSWAIYPLQRRVPHDGLAVVSQPDGYGLHIWVDTDTRQSGVCQPRWTPDAARLFNGNGTAPFSSGLVPRQEFFQVVARQDVQRALRQQSEALCLARDPRRSFRWQEPPLSQEQVKEEKFPLLEEPDLLSEPAEVQKREESLLKGTTAEPGAPTE
ncbi:hypothetical protein [Cyanobium sp. NIES-981]|uniref:hypothetical protein n=1 Tax=Cyanobium sp. NIES-981 TaxID=1851505 RepID=UPI0007DDD82C|nr:hypothetical protein [Cyanobium sp. NIES-981]SBO43744.1 conserved protein of unknown function [Cyanobium sp. NIES-981]